MFVLKKSSEGVLFDGKVVQSFEGIQLRAGVSYAEYSPDSLEFGEASDTGWKEEFCDCSFEDLKNYCDEYYFYSSSMYPVGEGAWWESGTETFDYSTGESVSYALHLTYIDGRKLSLEDIKLLHQYIVGDRDWDVLEELVGSDFYS